MYTWAGIRRGCRVDPQQLKALCRKRKLADFQDTLPDPLTEDSWIEALNETRLLGYWPEESVRYLYAAADSMPDLTAEPRDNVVSLSAEGGFLGRIYFARPKSKAAVTGYCTPTEHVVYGLHPDGSWAIRSRPQDFVGGARPPRQLAVESGDECRIPPAQRPSFLAEIADLPVDRAALAAADYDLGALCAATPLLEGVLDPGTGRLLRAWARALRAGGVERARIACEDPLGREATLDLSLAGGAPDVTFSFTPTGWARLSLLRSGGVQAPRGLRALSAEELGE